MSVSPIRTVAALLLAVSVGYGSYTVLKPQTFAYVKLREGVTVEGGSLLKEEHIERAVLTLGGMFAGNNLPMPGLIPWEDAPAYIGLPLVRRISGGMPLFVSDLDSQGEGMERDLDETKTGMSIPVDNILGVTPHLSVGDRVHLYASFEDEDGAHSGLLLREMPVIALQRELEGDVPQLVAVTIALKLEEAVLLTHALHYGKIHLGKASLSGGKGAGIGDAAFAKALMKTKKRWSDGEEERQ
jgi:pilus assembly protein CpaB